MRLAVRSAATRFCCHRRARASTCFAITRSAVTLSFVSRSEDRMANAAAMTMDFHPGLGARTRLGTGWEAPALLLLTITLLSFGFVTVYSASAVLAQSKGAADYHFLVRQMIAGVIGLVTLAVAALIDYRRLRLL